MPWQRWAAAEAVAQFNQADAVAVVANKSVAEAGLRIGHPQAVPTVDPETTQLASKASASTMSAKVVDSSLPWAPVTMEEKA